MTDAYLDANVYNDIERGAVSTDDDALQAALKSGDLAVRAGLVDFEGSLGI
jgi:hypothetical protein